MKTNFFLGYLIVLFNCGVVSGQTWDLKIESLFNEETSECTVVYSSTPLIFPFEIEEIPLEQTVKVRIKLVPINGDNIYYDFELIASDLNPIVEHKPIDIAEGYVKTLRIRNINRRKAEMTKYAQKIGQKYTVIKYSKN